MTERLGDRTGPRYERPVGPKFWVRKAAVYRLWFDYLAISPSYEAVRREVLGIAGTSSPFAMPSDADRVRSVYRQLGEVQRSTFSSWFNERTVEYFGRPGDKPEVRKLGVVGESIRDPERRRAAEMEMRWMMQHVGGNPARLVTLPLELSRTEILKQVDSLLKREKPAKQVEQAVHTPMYPLVGDRHRVASLQRFLDIAKLRAAYLDDPAWKIGLRFGLGANHAALFGPIETARPTAANEGARVSLNVIVTRMLTKARYIAENAARGRFPLHTKLDTALQLDFEWIATSTKERDAWMAAEEKRIEQLDAYWRVLPINFLSREWLDFELQLSDAMGYCDL